jgi:hypothetical protein
MMNTRKLGRLAHMKIKALLIPGLGLVPAALASKAPEVKVWAAVGCHLTLSTRIVGHDHPLIF